MRTTLVLPIVGQDGSTISTNKNPSFSSGGTNNADHLILTSSKQFQSAVVPGGRNSNPPPSAIPARCLQAYWTPFKLHRDKKQFDFGFMFIISDLDKQKIVHNKK